ncbi:hypothetical protein CWB72_10740 [Pseudoalteromonas phenolica]|nr:hypothetical protein CWB72_10740 [Pseudoalteromonas phenolica]
MSAALFDYLIPITFITGLFVCWKDINARFTISCFLIPTTISTMTLSWAMSMPVGFYIWSIVTSGIFLCFVFSRRYLAYKFKQIPFFEDAYKQHTYSVQEAVLILISLVCIFNNTIALVEVCLYLNYWIDNAYYKLYVRDNLQRIMIIMSAVVGFSYAIKKAYYISHLQKS